MVKKQYVAPQAIVSRLDGADIVTGSGELNGVKFSSFNVSWLGSGSDDEQPE
ncbi:MAG: hypothetical protein IJA89_00975 [Clostridia bacterium]|nr:hypothetical protein [Clostridia bacterium]